MPGQVHHIPGADGAYMGDNGHPPVRRLEHVLQHLLALLQGEQQPLPRGPAAVEALRAVLDLELHDALQGLIIDALVLVGGGDEGRPDLLELLRLHVYHAVQPPSITRLEPVIKEDAWEARKIRAPLYSFS